MPVISCEDCQFEFFDERGEAARHAAVCKHLGVQTPDEIRKVREVSGLGRAEFCELTGFGSASLQRWESGIFIPNASSDRLIFLLRFAENIERLRNKTSSVREVTLADIAPSICHVESSSDNSLVVRTRHATKRFHRLSSRSRVATEAANWNFKAR